VDTSAVPPRPISPVGRRSVRGTTRVPARTNREDAKGNRWLRTALIEAAAGASRAENSALQARFRRVLRHRGPKKAVVALAHTLLRIVYHVLDDGTTYRELVGDYYNRQHSQHAARRANRLLELQGVTTSPWNPRHERVATFSRDFLRSSQGLSKLLRGRISERTVEKLYRTTETPDEDPLRYIKVFLYSWWGPRRRGWWPPARSRGRGAAAGYGPRGPASAGGGVARPGRSSCWRGRHAAGDRGEDRRLVSPSRGTPGAAVTVVTA
jgi:hypothetical protein